MVKLYSIWNLYFGQDVWGKYIAVDIPSYVGLEDIRLVKLIKSYGKYEPSYTPRRLIIEERYFPTRGKDIYEWKEYDLE